MVRQGSHQLLSARPQKGSALVQFGPAVLLLVLSAMSQDWEMFLFGSVIFMIFYRSFFNANTPPVLLFIFFFQWFFNQGQLFNAVLNGTSLRKMFMPETTIDTVYYLGMIGTASFFAGILFFFRKIRPHSLTELKQLALQFNIDRLLVAYLISYPVLGTALSLVWLYPGLTQPIYMFIYFKWSLFFLLFVGVFAHNKHKAALLIIIFFEFAVGLGSFWASFKDVVYISFIAYWPFYFKGNVFLRWSLPTVILLMIYVGSIWSTIKQDYRIYLTGSLKTQGQPVSRLEAMDKFTDMFFNVSEQELDEGFDALILRLSWIGAFNRVYNYVPSHIPHQEGSLWATAVARPFTPRLLFPGKAALTDSQELNQYSGLNVDETNTSISLSAIAGSYIDYGPWGMHVPLLLFGIFVGWVYKKVFDFTPNFLVGYALSLPLIFIVNINEQSINRVVSSVVLYFLVMWSTSKFLLKPFMRTVLRTPRAR